MAALRLEVFADIACPWCWTGHQRLREALRDEEPGAVEVVHRAYELRPETGRTRRAHQLVKVAAHYDRGDEALEALFRAELEEGRDVGDPEVAVAVVAGAARLKAPALGAALQEGIGLPEVLVDLERAARLRIRGVPYFLAGGRVALSGAHEPPVLRRLLATARERAGAAPA